MAYKHIALATDGSPSAETAEHVAATLARAVKGKLTIVHAYTHADRVSDAVARALEIAEREGVKAEVVSSPDVPDHAIIELADRAEADLLVMGSRGFYKAEQVLGNALAGRVIADFVEHDIEQDAAAARWVVQNTGSTAVPVFQVGARVLQGFNPDALRRAVQEELGIQLL